MRNKILMIATLLIIFILSACSNSSESSDIAYYSSEDEAIMNGMTEIDSLLSVENHQGITLVFFERDGALGTSILTEESGKFKLVRNQPFIGFESDEEYLTGSYELKNNDEKVLNILAGKVFDPAITQIILEDNKTKEQIEIWNKELNISNLFYYVLGDDEYIDKKVLAIKN